MRHHTFQIGHLSLFVLILFLSAGCATIKPPDLIWPLPPEEPRIKYVKSIKSSADVEKKSFWKTLVEVTGNHHRRRIHRVDAATAQRLAVEVRRTNGDPSARIYEVRIYSEV